MSFRGKYETTLPLVSGDGWLRNGTEMPLESKYVTSVATTLILRGTATQSAEPCEKLDLTLDGSVIATRDVPPGNFEWRIPAAAFQGFHSAVGKLAFQSRCGFVPHSLDPASNDKRKLWIRVGSLAFRSSGTGGVTLPVKEVRPHCAVAKASVVCDLFMDEKTDVQLPVIFYDSLLQVTINGQRVPYQPSAYGPMVLTDVSLSPGINRVAAKFTGSIVGNILSLAGFFAILVASFISGWLHKTKRAAPL